MYDEDGDHGFEFSSTKDERNISHYTKRKLEHFKIVRIEQIAICNSRFMYDVPGNVMVLGREGKSSYLGAV